MKTELTIEEWRDIGNKAKAVAKAQLALMSALYDRVPKTSWEKKWFAVEKSFGRLRNHLDNIVCSKFLNLPDSEVTGIFYGDNK